LHALCETINGSHYYDSTRVAADATYAMLIITDFIESERDRSSQLLNISCYSEIKNMR